MVMAQWLEQCTVNCCCTVHNASRFWLCFTVSNKMCPCMCFFFLWGRWYPAECTAAYLGWLYWPCFSFPLSSPGVLHVRWHERPLSAKGGTMGEKCLIKLSLTMATSCHCRVILHATKLRHETDGFTSPPKEGMLRIFSPETSDGFGLVWTCRLGYQRPAC
jgi:hypothetical protein